MASFESAWTLRRFVFLKASLILVLATAFAYASWEPMGGHDGGTSFGTALGIVCATLMVWLMWLGVRKRSYHARGWSLRTWVSAHVYIGTSLLFLVPLHAGFEFHWNVHTLAYGLMVVVILSGLVGLVVYARVPGAITRDMPGEKFEALLQKVADLDSEWRSVARDLPDAVAEATRIGIEQTRIGGGLLRRLAGRDPRCGTRRALAIVRECAQQVDEAERQRLRDLIGLIARKQALLRRIRRIVRHRTLLDVWLTLHVPFSFASLAAVIVHVFAVYYYR